MNLLSAESLAKSYDERTLFDDLTFGLQQGEKIALVGPNGAGKTTLLKTLAGFIEPDSGKVALRQGVRMSYLEQQPELNPALTVAGTLFDAGNEIAAVVASYEHALAHPDSVSDDKMQHILERMDELSAWDYEARQKQILGKLGIDNLDAFVSELSGGQIKRVALAKLLLSEPDVILLDEPTNHLDLGAIEWLENHLRSAQTTLLMITHDRYFLDNVSSVILELNQGKIYRYEGNYAYYLEKKAEREAGELAAIERARNLYSRELEWMRRQPKARGTKAKYRVEAFEEIKEQAFKNVRKDSIQLEVQARRQGGKVLELHHLNKSLGGKPLLKDFSYTFRKGDRIGIIGRNGVGKSTFLNLITGRLAPDTGEVLWGQTTAAGYYTQHTDDLTPGSRLIDEVKNIAEYVTLADGKQVSASKLLDMFLFPPAKQYAVIDKLSGGERRRLQLLKVLVANPNFLILDEPTNDLDIDTLNVLEQFLVDFGGCLVLVSHDRYFMDRLVEHLFVFEGEGIVKDYPGNYTSWREEEDEAKARQIEGPAKISVSAAPVAAPAAPKGPGRKLSYKEQKELEALTIRIPELEAKKTELTEEMSDASDFTRLEALAHEIQTIDRELDALTSRWLELEG